MNKTNVFVDMDGVLAVYSKRTTELMHNKGFFYNRPPITHMLKVVKKLTTNKNYDMFILSSVIDSPYCVPEKEKWLDKYLPEIKKENRIFVPYGTVKADFVRDRVSHKGKVNVLIDDYTDNLVDWDLDNALPIKVLNGINSTRGTWKDLQGSYIDIDKNVDFNVKTINKLIKDKK